MTGEPHAPASTQGVPRPRDPGTPEPGTPRPGASDAGHGPPAPPRTPPADPAAKERLRVLALGVLLVLVSVVTTLAAFANPPADLAAYRLVRRTDLLAPLEEATVLGSTPVLVALALLVLVGVRCRTYLLIAGGALGVAVGLALGAPLVVPRDVPVESLSAATDSYPDPRVLVLAVLAGLVPVGLALRVPLPRVRLVSGAVLVLAVAALAVARVRAAEHWPLDVLGAALVGAVLVLVGLVLLDQPYRHRWCRSCRYRVAPAAPLAEVLDAPAAPHLATTKASRHDRLHEVTLVWAVGLLAAGGFLSLTRGLPRTPESGAMGEGLEAPLQWGLLILVLVGVLVARRRHVTGAVVAGLAAALLGYAASVQYSPLIAVAVATVAFVPALLLWVEWHRDASLRAALAVATVTALVLGGVVTAAASTYSTYWGPTHPASATPAPVDDVVQWMWSGGVTSTSVDVRARLTNPADEVRLVVSEQPTLTDPVHSATVAPDADRVVAASVSGLRPDTRYHYALEVDGRVHTDRRAQVTTFPDGQSSYTFALSGDALTGSNGRVYDAVRAKEPLFFLSMGDFFYGDIDVNDPGRFRSQFDASLTAPAQAALYASTSVAYLWGDHDYGGNDADGTSPSRPAAHRVYRQYVPHQPLVGGPEDTVNQAFTVGRVRFVMTDNRSARDPASVEPRSMLGEEQRAWLLDELSRADEYAAVVWMNGDPWIEAADPTSDSWGGFDAERRLIADALADGGVRNLLMVSGDAHMLGFDDGTNTDYSTDRVGGFPLLQAASLDRTASLKGGPYTGPVVPAGGQFATIDVDDRGTTVDLTLTGWNWRSETVFTRTLTFDVSPQAAQ